ncbi:MAG: hypothetical protein AAGM22_02795 [Acidobacteriota bacterium]
MVPRLAPLLYAFVVLAATPAVAQLCPPPIQAAPTVPQFRTELPGESIWPLDSSGQAVFRPASNITEDRNSTTYNTYCLPGSLLGLELFQDLAALDGESDWLFVAYNAGIQVWDLRQTPANPRRETFRDGWERQIEIFPSPGEGDTYIDAIDAVRSAAGGVIYIAAAGEIGHGLAFWRFDPEEETLTQTFQDSGRTFRDVELVQRNGRVYAFATDPSDSLGGVLVYDVTAADTSPCFDETWPTTCPMLLGHMGSIVDATYVDTLERGDALYVVASDGSSNPGDPMAVEIWRVDDPSRPEPPPAGAALPIFQGLETNHRGVQIFDIDGRPVLATILTETQPTPNESTLRVYNLAACLADGGCNALGAPIWSKPLPRIDGNFQFLTASKSTRRTFVYYGLETTPLAGQGVEQLFDVTGLGPNGNGQAIELTESGGDYRDPESGLLVDYWGDYYGNNFYGLNNLLPRHGLFVGNLFYRVAVGVLDVHRLTPSADLFMDGFESGDCSAWSPNSTPCQ